MYTLEVQKFLPNANNTEAGLGEQSGFGSVRMMDTPYPISAE